MKQTKTAEERKALCVRWEQSGISQAEFCRINSINAKSFQRWRLSCRKEVVKKEEIKKIDFMPIGKIEKSCSTLEIKKANGTLIRSQLAAADLITILKEVIK